MDLVCVNRRWRNFFKNYSVEIYLLIMENTLLVSYFTGRKVSETQNRPQDTFGVSDYYELLYEKAVKKPQLIQ